MEMERLLNVPQILTLVCKCSENTFREIKINILYSMYKSTERGHFYPIWGQSEVESTIKMYQNKKICIYCSSIWWILEMFFRILSDSTHLMSSLDTLPQLSKIFNNFSKSMSQLKSQGEYPERATRSQLSRNQSQKS